jgi:2',3'-cyclic-nucleotide 2'-phosphodiesterase/3'-nucleotidase
MRTISLITLLVLSAAAYASDDITVVEINDFHGQMQPHKNMVGAGKIATFLQNYRKQYPHTIVVSGGDNYQGTAISNLSKGAIVNDFFNYIGMQYSAIGNHEFDYGQAAFESWSKTNHFPFLAANIVESSTGSVFKYAQPYGELTLDNNKKIAFVGLATLETPETTSSKNIAGLKFIDPAAAANQWIKFLNSKGNPLGKPNVIVLLTHIPTEQNSTSTKIGYNSNSELGSSEIAYVTKKVSGAAAVLTGHSHLVVDGYLNGDAVVQGASQGKALSVLHIDCHTKPQCSVTPEVINLESATKNLVSDPKIDKLIDKYYEQNKTILNQRVTTSEQSLNNMPESGLYNIKLTYTIADIMRKITHSDVGLQNTYGIRRSLPAGAIDYSMIYEAMPFDNTVTTVEVNGKDLLALIQHSLPTGKIQLGVFAGVNLSLNKDGAIEKVLVNGKPLDEKTSYKVATIDFLTSGGDGFDFTNGHNLINTNIPIREVVKEEWLKNGISVPADWQSISVNN